MSVSDYTFAKVLQEQFQNEYESDKSADSLTYKTKKHDLNSSKSLIDPSWEVIDPTPDIHILFVAFNERFFWNQLLSACVSWSKRMTTCAGICTYHGRGGMCSITLSEPLLKLRPRSDLIETLLHEMIHAYLFITHNNRDRDGHGPEFHKHMFRINAEAGTNITVYHDFHDEVRLYKQHWWKCNGPCQNWKPYFGLVKRAMNRAPGPNDRWWGEHSRNCNGEFIKIKEPDRNKLPTSKAQVTKKKPETITTSLPDIRKHFGKSNNSVVSGKPATITTINDLTSPEQKPSGKPVTGFPENPGRKLSNVEVLNKSYSVVRNHWVTKFSGEKKIKKTLNELNSSTVQNNASCVIVSASSGPSGLKRTSDDSIKLVSEKIPKLIINLDELNTSFVECPICSQKYSNENLNHHLDQCLQKTQQCFVCDKEIPQADYEQHVSKCLDIDNKLVEMSSPRKSESPPTFEKTPTKCPSEKSACLICDKEINIGDLTEHLENCKNLSDIFDDNETIPIEEEDKENSRVECPVCSDIVKVVDINVHMDVCLKIKECKPSFNNLSL